MKLEYFSSSESDTYNFAMKFSARVKKGDVFLIEGPLGVGKSIFVRGISEGLGVKEKMPSPSFTILNEYRGKLPVYHFDFYRINDPYELFEIGLEEYLYGEGVCFIEWPSLAAHLLPKKSIKVKIDFKENGRVIKISWKE